MIERQRRDGVARMWHAHGSRSGRLWMPATGSLVYAGHTRRCGACRGRLRPSDAGSVAARLCCTFGTLTLAQGGPLKAWRQNRDSEPGKEGVPSRGSGPVRKRGRDNVLNEPGEGLAPRSPSPSHQAVARRPVTIGVRGERPGDEHGRDLTGRLPPGGESPRSPGRLCSKCSCTSCLPWREGSSPPGTPNELSIRK